MKELIVYFYDNVLAIVYQGKVRKYKLNCICNGMVVHRACFLEKFLKILKSEKIRSKLFGDKIFIVKDVYFKESDLFYLENIFIELGFIKVEYIDIKDLLNDSYTYIGVFQNYMVFYFLEPVVVSLKYFRDISKLISYFKEYYQEYVVLFGSNENIPLIQAIDTKIYYIDQYQDYITKSLLKVKKYEV